MAFCLGNLFVKSGVAHLCVSVISHITTVYQFILAVKYFHKNAPKFLFIKIINAIINANNPLGQKEGVAW